MTPESSVGRSRIDTMKSNLVRRPSTEEKERASAGAMNSNNNSNTDSPGKEDKSVSLILRYCL